MRAAPLKGAVPASPTYRKMHGDRLTSGEAAQLLIRIAQGERLTFVPVKTAHGYRLAHVATLSPQQRAEHARRVREVAATLAAFAASTLSA